MTRLQSSASSLSDSNDSCQTSATSRSSVPASSLSSPPTSVSSPSPTALPSRWPSQLSQFGEQFDIEAQSCDFEANAYFPENVGDCADIPSREDLEKAGELPIYDSRSRPRPFKSLYSGDGVIGRQLVVWVRHFYCGACQAYIKYLTKHITPEAYFTLPVPTSIIIIGCGSPQMINKYARITNCPFPIYADPSRRLYKALGMSWSVKVGRQPDYLDVNAARLVYSSLAVMARSERILMFKGGSFAQIGGEFMFEDGECTWGHRMRNVRDHTEMGILRKVLEMDYEIPVIEEARPVVMSPSPTKGLKLILNKARSASLSNLRGGGKAKERPESQYMPECSCQSCVALRQLVPVGPSKE